MFKQINIILYKAPSNMYGVAVSLTKNNIFEVWDDAEELTP